MRATARKSGIRVHATVGTRNVLLGMDATAAASRDLLGFRVERFGPGARDRQAVPSAFTFEGFDPGDLNARVVQQFHWCDYAAEPGRAYTYHVTAVYGTPSRMRARAPVEVDVKTEKEDAGVHRIHFNRGASASHAFGELFPRVALDLRRPDSPPLRWLSRGLLEGLLAFIDRARDDSWSLRGSLYEFTYPPILQAFKAAHNRGVSVRLVVDHLGAAQENDEAIARAGIKSLVIPRKSSGLSISHNKFVILLRGKTPVAVWTGSTNHTSDGLFGQSNVGHALTDRTVARTYLDYWRMIATNPSRAAFAAWNDEHTPLSRLDGSDGIKVVFSPRSTTEAMRRYESMLAKARHGAFLTAAFGVSNEFTEVLLQRRKYLRYILMDNKGQTGNAANTVKIRQNPLNLIALGDVIKSGELGHWPEEHLTGLNEWVKYVHTKFLLLDPLSDRPTVLTGSANFSDASVTSNDENMLIIRGDTRVADVYLSDFMRQFTGFAFRNQLDQITEHDYGPRGKHLRDAKRRKPLDIHLAPDASWLKPHFKRGSPLEMQRLYFSGQARD